ncbi:hypothetical protein AAFF_G00185770 [Aldrovandia affinis]|uniref:Uncharacterized protein n=1 Tax=Aldrovandia affinis TaxID=143900 RepID=A0AAD7W5Y3_9TELE|nr:hypothetical protein AAFF_G00185770 [Aldrovandia affinis]
MLRHFVKRELLHDISLLQLVKLDVSDKKNWVHPTEVKIGLGAESVLKVPLSKEMLASAASARSRYRMHLEEEKRKKMSDVQGQKRKAAEEEIEELKKSKATLKAVTNSLSQDADQLAEKAEGKAGTLMAQLITKSNTLRKRHREKMVELKKVEAELEKRATELRYMPPE